MIFFKSSLYFSVIFFFFYLGMHVLFSRDGVSTFFFLHNSLFRCGVLFLDDFVDDLIIFNLYIELFYIHLCKASITAVS